MHDYDDTSTQKRVDYTPLLRKYLNVEEMRDIDPPLFDDLIEQGFHRIAFQPSDVKDRIVLDMGAHIGVFTALAVAHEAKKVYAVEMNPENYQNLLKFTVNMPSVECRNWAISDDATKFLYPRESGTICKGHKTGEGVRVPAVSFDDIVKVWAGVSGDATLKMDIEGSEYDALYCASGDSIRRFKTILMEIHPAVDEKGPGRNAEFLKEYLGFFGFKVTYVTPVFFYMWGADGKMTSCERVKDLELVRLERT